MDVSTASAERTVSAPFMRAGMNAISAVGDDVTDAARRIPTDNKTLTDRLFPVSLGKSDARCGWDLDRGGSVSAFSRKNGWIGKLRIWCRLCPLLN
ncbi:hypothetical protein [Tritonibacter scottomollicae]|uniref:hypothetical protein n=1 Tax=Tritonibacter scottomollicae TaxID=483013 RepID=UPI003AA89497